MFSMTSLLATLPPASLAESDLPRFVTRAFGRRLTTELPGLRALFDEEPLTGYPPSLGAILAASAERMIADGVDPAGLDPASAERILASSAFLRAVERRAPMDRQILRPGEILTVPLRELLGAGLHVLDGAGPQLALVAPVAVVHLPGVRYSIPRGPVLARPMELDEADAIRLAWGAVEEAFPFDDAASGPWHARFATIASRPNHDAAAVVAAMAALPAARRARIWLEVVEHLRDQEVVEQHRPGARGLAARLGRLGLDADAPWLAALLDLATLAWASTALDPEVARGVCPCTAQDLETWCGWVEVPPAARDQVRALRPEEIERALAVLADIEAQHLDVAFPGDLQRPLRALRDQLLRPRYARARAAIDGVDPLRLAEARVKLGCDRAAILAQLEALADEAGQAAASRPPVSLRSRRAADDGAGALADDRAAAVDGAGDGGVDDALLAGPPAPETPPPAGAASADTPPATGPELAGTADPEPTPPPSAPAPGPPTAPNPEAAPRPAVSPDGVRPPRFELPPLPIAPPPRPRPRTRPRVDFPPMPDAPLPPPRPRTGAGAGAPPVRPRSLTGADIAGGASVAAPESPKPSGRTTAAAEPSPEPRVAPPASPPADPLTLRRAERGAESAAPEVKPREAPSPARPRLPTSPPPAAARARAATAPGLAARPVEPSRRRPPTTPHLVTPTQGSDFYDSAFKELELLERELLRRGPRRAAAERVEALEREATELASALGPSARSGDRDFAAALRRVEMVQAYLARVRTLLSGEAPQAAPPVDDDTRRGGALRRLFGRRR